VRSGVYDFDTGAFTSFVGIGYSLVAIAIRRLAFSYYDAASFSHMDIH
jgi:hypothetical protein